MKKVVYQGHHPDRELWPSYTIKLRKWVHMYVRRLEQFNPTKENIDELEKVVRAVTWIYHLKVMEYEQGGCQDENNKDKN